jgi:hypothetical protein
MMFKFTGHTGSDSTDAAARGMEPTIQLLVLSRTWKNRVKSVVFKCEVDGCAIVYVKKGEV